MLAAFAMNGPGSTSSTGVPIAPAVIERCRQGDRGALDEVFRAHAASLERLLARLIGPRADVEDLLQETFAAAMHAFPRFRGEASVRSWMHRIAVHIAHHHLRTPHRRRETALDDAPAIASDHASATDVLATAQLSARLYHHLAKLDARKRIALILHVIEGCSMSEVAALMGSSQAAAKSRVFWARRGLLASLRRDPMFADHGGEG